MLNMAQWAAIFGGARGDDDEGGGGMIGMLAMAILAPFAAMFIQMAISRSREYLADDGGARVSGKPWRWRAPWRSCRRQARPSP